MPISSILPSLLETTRRQNKNGIDFLVNFNDLLATRSRLRFVRQYLTTPQTIFF